MWKGCIALVYIKAVSGKGLYCIKLSLFLKEQIKASSSFCFPFETMKKKRKKRCCALPHELHVMLALCFASRALHTKTCRPGELSPEQESVSGDRQESVSGDRQACLSLSGTPCSTCVSVSVWYTL